MLLLVSGVHLNLLTRIRATTKSSIDCVSAACCCRTSLLPVDSSATIITTKSVASSALPFSSLEKQAKRLFCQQHTSTVNMAGGDQHTASAEARKVGAPEDGKHHPSALRNREVIWEKLEPIFGRMSTFSESVRVLEVGCGSGAHAEWFGDKVRDLNCKSRTPDFPWPIMRQAGYHFNIFWERTDRDFESIEQVCNPTGVRENREDRMKFRTTVPFVLDLLDPLGAKLRAEDAPYALWNSDPAAKRQVGNKSHQHAAGGQGEGEVAYDEDYFFYDMVYASNLCHISPWEATENLWRVVVPKADADKVILYGPFKKDNAFTMAGPGATESNRLFDEDLRKRNPSWGLRDLEKVEGLAAEVGFQLRKVHNMPANNFLLVFERTDETGNERVEDYAGERRGYFAPAIQKYEWFEDRDRRRSPSDSET